MSQDVPAIEPDPAALEPLLTTGLAHDHFRIRGTGRLLRVPKQSQLGLAAADNLAYQAACFARASRSGHAPRLHGIIRPSARWPLGALVVDEIEGRPPGLPEDLPAIAAALATIHSLPLPPAAERPPLKDQADPLGATLDEVMRQGRHLDAAAVDPDARAMVEAELTWARGFAGTDRRPRVSLISFDAHPGNFLIRPDDAAILVDLEKARYGAPGFDLAHASLYTSTTWDVATYAELDPAEVAAFYAAWLEAAAPQIAAAARPWLLPTRRIMWLWSVTWCAKWRVESARSRRADGAGSAEDWSADLSTAELVAHVRGRVDHYLEPGTIARIRAEWQDDNELRRLCA
jgi:thiamine kinase-like enzyme